MARSFAPPSLRVHPDRVLFHVGQNEAQKYVDALPCDNEHRNAALWSDLPLVYSLSLPIY